MGKKNSKSTYFLADKFVWREGNFLKKKKILERKLVKKVWEKMTKKNIYIIFV